MEESSHCWCVLIASDLLLCHLHLRHDNTSYHQIMMNVESVVIHMSISYLFIKHWMNFVHVAAVETCVNRAGFKNKCSPIQINLNLDGLIHNIPWSNFWYKLRIFLCNQNEYLPSTKCSQCLHQNSHRQKIKREFPTCFHGAFKCIW